MAEDGSGFNCENGSSKNQTSTSEKKRRASKEASHVWVPLKRRKAPRGNPEAAASKRLSRSAKQVPQDECYYRRECSQGIGVPRCTHAKCVP